MKTNQAYINEYNIFDEMYECVNETESMIAQAVYEYNYSVRQTELSSFFENTDMNYILEKEGESLLGKIGQGIMNLVERIRKFITDIFSKFKDDTKDVRTDVEIVSQMCKESPELQESIVDGINKEWFTVRDIAAYEKDIVGLINLLKKKAIDNETFMDRVKARGKKFLGNVTVLGNGCKSAKEIFGLVPNMLKSAGDTKQHLSHLTETIEEFKRDIEKNYTIHDAGMAKSISNALAQAVGLSTKECEHRYASTTGISGFFHNLANSGVGRFVHADDDHRKAKHDRARDKYIDKLDRLREGHIYDDVNKYNVTSNLKYKDPPKQDKDNSKGKGKPQNGGNTK